MVRRDAVLMYPAFCYVLPITLKQCKSSHERSILEDNMRILTWVSGMHKVDLCVWTALTTVDVLVDVYRILDVRLCHSIMPFRRKSGEILIKLYVSDETWY